MDEPMNTEPKTPSQPPTGRFMDIQAPSGNAEPAAQTAPVVNQPDAPTESIPAEPASEQHDEVVISPEGQLSEVKVAEQSTEEPIVPVELAPVEPAPDKPAVSETSPNEPPANPLENQPPATPEHPPLPPKSHGIPVAAVVVAIIVTLGLSGLVIFAYIKSKNDTKLGEGTPTPTAISQQPVAKPQASPADIDQVTADIDQSLDSIDASTDFSADAISDQALGL